MNDAPPEIKYGRGGGIDSVDRSFGCPNCGSEMAATTSGSRVLYCPEYDCEYDLNHNKMSIEQRFYVHIIRNTDSIGAKDDVKNWFESVGKDV